MYLKWPRRRREKTINVGKSFSTGLHDSTQSAEKIDLHFSDFAIAAADDWLVEIKIIKTKLRHLMKKTKKKIHLQIEMINSTN